VTFNHCYFGLSHRWGFAASAAALSDEKGKVGDDNGARTTGGGEDGLEVTGVGGGAFRVPLHLLLP